MSTSAHEGVLPALSAIPEDVQSLADYERHAQAHFPATSWQHLQSGSGAERSLRENLQQFERYQIVPNMLQNLQHATTEIELFGHRHATPFMLAPVAYHRLAHPEGEIASIRAATALDTTMIVSTLASYTLEEIADSARSATIELGRKSPPPLWFQLYFQADLGYTAELIQRAESSGYQAIVFTVDASIKRSSFLLPEGVDAANLRGMPRLSQNAHMAQGSIVFGSALLQAMPTWESLQWLRQQTKLPIIVKGLLAPNDARKGRDLGADGLIVSNHGGRVMDGLASPLDQLPSMIEAVDDAIPILLDSGVRSGTDILKALALGAKAALIGRPQMHALAVGGLVGVAHMLHILRAELELAMAHTGCAHPHAIPRSILKQIGR